MTEQMCNCSGLFVVLSSCSRCISSVVWDSADNLLGEDGSLVLEAETGSGGCEGGLADPDSPSIDGQVVACKRMWRFFNVNGSGKSS